MSLIGRLPMTITKARCPVCGKLAFVRDGKVFKGHGRPPHGTCSGSGKPIPPMPSEAP